MHLRMDYRLNGLTIPTSNRPKSVPSGVPFRGSAEHVIGLAEWPEENAPMTYMGDTSSNIGHTIFSGLSNCEGRKDKHTSIDLGLDHARWTLPRLLVWVHRILLPGDPDFEFWRKKGPRRVTEPDYIALFDLVEAETHDLLIAWAIRSNRAPSDD